MSEKSGYIPLFGSIIHSSIWRQPDHVRILWITMIAMADAEGYVGASLPGLAHAARIPKDQCTKALAVLMQPDPYSRDPTDKGQRVFEADRGWIIPGVPRLRAQIGGNASRCKEYRNRKKFQKTAADKQANQPRMNEAMKAQLRQAAGGREAK